MADIDWSSLISAGMKLADAGITYANATAAQKQALDALAMAQKNIGATSAMYDAVGVPSYKGIDPASTQVGDTELKGIQSDPQGRLAEQQAITELQKLADNGGLSLSDMKALNDIQGNLNRNNMARQNATANQFAARGQLGSGAQLAMALRGNQDAAMSANDRGESIAAQAQQRALQAITSKATMGRQMSEDDYNKKAKAAEAADMIKQRNMANSIGAQRYNNELQGQGFDDRFNIAKAKGGLLGAANQNALQTGAQNMAGTTANGQLASSVLQTGANAFGKMGSTGDANPPLNNTPDWKEPGVASQPGEWGQWNPGSQPPTVVDEPSKLTEED